MKQVHTSILWFSGRNTVIIFYHEVKLSKIFYNNNNYTVHVNFTHKIEILTLWGSFRRLQLLLGVKLSKSPNSRL